MNTKIYYIKSKVTKFFEYKLDFALDEILKQLPIWKYDKIIIRKEHSNHMIICKVKMRDFRNLTCIARLQKLKNNYNYYFFDCVLYNLETHKICNRKIITFDDYI